MALYGNGGCSTARSASRCGISWPTRRSSALTAVASRPPLLSRWNAGLSAGARRGRCSRTPSPCTLRFAAETTITPAKAGHHDPADAVERPGGAEHRPRRGGRHVQRLFAATPPPRSPPPRRGRATGRAYRADRSRKGKCRSAPTAPAGSARPTTAGRPFPVSTCRSSAIRELGCADISSAWTRMARSMLEIPGAAANPLPRAPSTTRSRPASRSRPAPPA